MNDRLSWNRVALPCVLLLCGALAGCAIFGVMANALPGRTIQPKYTGLQNQSVAVMTWAPSAIQLDFDTLRFDVSAGVQSKLRQEQAKKTKQVEGARFPLQPASVVIFQDEHPEFESQSILQVAQKLGVSRLIYIEMENVLTRSDEQVDLFRGTMSATVKLIEVENGKAREAFSENNVQVVFPPKAPDEGIPGASDYTIYRGTLDAFTTEVVHRFVPYEEPQS